MQRFKLLLFTHLSAFATGVFIGKSIDAEELAAYRSASNDATSAWVKKIMIGVGVLLTTSTLGMWIMGGSRSGSRYDQLKSS